MKKCPYCGKEYADEATICLIDGESLRDNNPQPPISDKQIIDVATDKNAPYLTFPDYQWSARDAWKCLGTIVVFEIFLEIIGLVLDSCFSDFRKWHGSGFGYFSTGALNSAIYVLAAAYFARTETLATFLQGFSFDRKPSNYVWFGVVMTLIIRFFGDSMLIHGWGKGVSNYDVRGLEHTVGFERYFFLLAPLLLAPLFEESLNRGFLYKAFRKSYSLVISMTLIVAWTAFTHWPYYSHSLLAAFCLSLITIVQCYLREKSDSLWDCIFCHFVFNASSLLFITVSPH
jgi:membrane protease YdiL (CAAX protease family)